VKTPERLAFLFLFLFLFVCRLASDTGRPAPQGSRVAGDVKKGAIHQWWAGEHGSTPRAGDGVV
jgi:hypothetical protein